MKTKRNKKNKSRSHTLKKDKTRQIKGIKRTRRTYKKSKNIKGGKKRIVIPKPTNYLATVDKNNNDDFAHISMFANDYNKNIFVQESHNCYTYFLNMKSQKAVDLCKQDYGEHNFCRRAQPGYYSGYGPLKKTDYNCPTIMKRTLDDNPQIYQVKDINAKCKPGYYKGALVVAPGRDYHYYRQDDDGAGFWSHKPGYKPSTTRDSEGNLIVDPQLASRDYGGTLNYSEFCGYLCVPRNSDRKNMSHRGQLDKRSEKVLEKAYEAQEKIVGKAPPKENDNKSTNSALVSLGRKVKELIQSKK